MDDKKIKKEETIAVDSKESIDQKEPEHKVDRVEQLEIKIAELEDQLKRAVADYRNLERRSSEERSEAIRFANKSLIESLLPALDTLFLAGIYTKDESVKLTIARILEVLKENGIEKINTFDAQYNAQLMEAVEAIEGEKDKVIEEMRPGFTVYGKLIRPAQVKVGIGG